MTSSPSKLSASTQHQGTVYAGLLEDAVMNGALDQIAHQLRGGVSPDHSSKQFGSLVAMAAESRQPEALRALLAAGAHPNATNIDDIPALSIAASLGRIDMVELLLDHGASFEPEHCLASHFPLFAAIVDGQTRALRFMLERGARVDVLDQVGRTPLLVAVDRDEADCACICLAFGADINVQSGTDGSTPAMFGILSESADTMRALCEHGFDLSITDLSGETVETMLDTMPIFKTHSIAGAQVCAAWLLSMREAEAITDSVSPPDTARTASAPRI